MWLVNIWKLPISDIGCHRGDGRHTHYCHRGRQHCRNNSKLCINFKTGLGQNHISEKIWHWCRGSTLGFFHPQQHCKRRKQIFMRILHQPLLGIRGGICPSRQSRRECKIFASGVNFSKNNAIYNINESAKYILSWFYI